MRLRHPWRAGYRRRIKVGAREHRPFWRQPGQCHDILRGIRWRGQTSCLYALPAALPYFNKASIESGPGVRMAEVEVAAETARLLLKQLQIDPANWRKLLDLPAADLLAAQVMLKMMAGMAAEKRTIGIGAARLGEFGPVVDGRILPADTLRSCRAGDIPLQALDGGLERG